MYKSIFFDIDDTLLDFGVASRSAFINSFDEFNITQDDSTYILYKKINHSLWDKQKNGKITVQDVIDNRFKELFISLDIEVNFNDFRDVFQANLAKEHTVVDGALEVVSYLSEKYQLFAASNSFLNMQKNRLQKANLLNYFSDLYISNEIGYEKPDFRFFEFCLNKSKMVKEEVLFVGDSLDADMKGAFSSGIDTCWFNPKLMENVGDININYIIENLIDLKAIL